MQEERKIPIHIAFIMDGNGRWAKRRLMPRKFGHKMGVEALKRVIDACEKAGVKEVSFYALSTENWLRPKDEIDALLDMVKKFADDELQKYVEKNYRVRFMGELHRLPEVTRAALEKIARASAGNTGIVVNIGLNYGGRDEIVRAVNKLIEEKKPVTVESLNLALDTAGMNDPDVIVRSAGEKRLSNFMLWQSAYSEFVYIDDFWPDFDAATVERIIAEYSKRQRRFGALQ